MTALDAIIDKCDPIRTAAFRQAADGLREVIGELLPGCTVPGGALSTCRFCQAIAAYDAATKGDAHAGEWQPIETAPKDGTKVVLAEYEPAYFDDEPDRWRFWTDWWRKYDSVLGGEGFGAPRKPTHWMPLPDPPVDPPAKGAGS